MDGVKREERLGEEEEEEVFPKERRRRMRQQPSPALAALWTPVCFLRKILQTGSRLYLFILAWCRHFILLFWNQTLT